MFWKEAKVIKIIIRIKLSCNGPIKYNFFVIVSLVVNVKASRCLYVPWSGINAAIERELFRKPESST